MEDKNVKLGIQELEGTLGIITSEDKARSALFSDPVTLNFKLLIDWNCNYGLFGTGINSAVSYFNRIGDVVRSELTQRFISEFQKFIQDYDWLILGCDGLQEIFNRNPWMLPSEDEKVTLTIRETIDLRVQSLISMYKNIWWDDVRMVEVLPVNLRRFNCCILVYSSGYFNNLLYGIQAGNENNSNINDEPERWILPTKKKLDTLNIIGQQMTQDAWFNHVRINLIDAQLDFTETGKNFFSELSNEMSGDYVKNNITLKYRFSNTTGLFTNVSGSKYISDMLIIMNEMNKSTRSSNRKGNVFKNYWKDLKQAFGNAAKSQWHGLQERGKNLVNTYTKNLGDTHIVGSATHIGNALNQFINPNNLVGRLDNAVSAGIGLLENKAIRNLTELENKVSRNFRPEILTDLVYERFLGTSTKNHPKTTNNIELNTESNTYEPMSVPPRNIETVSSDIEKGISFGQSNVFTRNTF